MKNIQEGETVSPDDQDRLTDYINNCFKVVNKRFIALVVVQPGIQLVQAEGKAALNNGYIEHLNSLILGLSVDERIKTAHFYLPRHLTGLDERIGAVDFALNRAKQRAVDEHRLDTTLVH